MIRPFVGLMMLALGSSACAGGGGSAGGDGPGEDTVTVVASFYPLAEAASRVGGTAVRVTNLTPAGTEPHDMELTPRQVDQIQDGDLVLYLGGGFQPAVEEVALGRRGSVDVLAELDEHVDEEPGGAVDPHFWLDPTLMVQAVDIIEAALVRVHPDAASALEAGADAYRQELQGLDREFSQGLATCQRREIVTSHAAFHYLVRRYELVQTPIAGLSPESEPDPRRLAELSDLIRARDITTVFYEALVSPEVAETLAREAKVQTGVLDPLEGLSDDEVSRGGNYLTVMRRNLQALRQALGCV